MTMDQYNERPESDSDKADPSSGADPDREGTKEDIRVTEPGTAPNEPDTPDTIRDGKELVHPE